jgi:putative flippase GtrA
MLKAIRGSGVLLERITKFGVVGILNTAIDFLLFNILSSKKVGWGKIAANTASTTAAMIFSFFFNKTFVFGADGGNVTLQVVEFFIVTMFGLYILQNLVIWFLTTVWTFLPELAVKIVGVLRLNRVFKRDFVIKNSAKVAATLVSLTWNFILYSKVVFK